jgi:hypothetical protein
MGYGGKLYKGYRSNITYDGKIVGRVAKEENKYVPPPGE